MFFEPKVISESKQLNVVRVEAVIDNSLDSKVTEVFCVEFVTTKVIKQYGTLKTVTETEIDRLAFPTFEAAFEYGQNIDRVSIPRYPSLSEGKPIYTDACVFPKGYNEILKQVQATGVSRNIEEFEELVTVNSFCSWSSPYCASLSTYKRGYFFDHIWEVYQDENVKNIIATLTLSSNPTREVVKRMMITEVGNYEVDEAADRLAANRNEVIDKELERIEKYKQFLLSMRK